MTELRQRDPRVECPAFLAFLRRKPCCVCGAPAPSQAAHIGMANLEVGKRYTGINEKASDRWATPLCSDCHLDGPSAQHRIGERLFWKAVSIDPFKIATDLWDQFQRRQARSPEQRERVVKRAVRIKKKKGRSWNKPAPDLLAAGNQLQRATKRIQNSNRWPPKGSRPMRRKAT